MGDPTFIGIQARIATLQFGEGMNKTVPVTRDCHPIEHIDMSTFKEKLKHEVRELIPVTLFFFVAFQLLAFTQALMLEQYGIRAWSFMTATIGALIIAKVVIIADHFAFVNRFPHKPLIYNIVWKTGIYFLGSIIVRYAEHIIHFWRKSGSFAEANHLLGAELIWPHVLGVQMWLLVLLLAYCTARELIRALGHKRLKNLVFSDVCPPAQVEPASESSVTNSEA